MEQNYQNLSAYSSDSSSSSSTEETYSYATVSSPAPKRRAGRTKFEETRHPLYKGVRHRGRDGQRWVCELRDPSNNKSRLWLGTFPTAVMAARAHDAAALALRGHTATLNFADSAWLLPILPVSLGRAAIQRAASEAARAFRYPSFEAEATSLAATDTLSDSSESSTAKQSGLEMIESLNDPFGMVEYVGMQGGYYACMAEALLIDLPPPPAIVFEEEREADFSLWSFS